MTTTAFVLSGGGSKGDFEIGALHFLYYQYQQGLRPDLLVTTSVGSVNGLKLAEGEGQSDQGLAGLTALWLSLDSYADFFREESWLTQGEPAWVRQWIRQFILDFASKNPPSVENQLAINPTLVALHEQEILAIYERQRSLWQFPDIEMPTLDDAAITFFAPSPISSLHAAQAGVSLVQLIPTLLSIPSIPSLVNDLISARSMFTFAPLIARAQTAIDFGRVRAWTESEKRLLMATVALRSGELRYVTQDGLLLDRAGTPVRTTGRRAGPCQAQLDRVGDLLDQIADLQEQLRQGPQRMPGIGLAIRTAQGQLSDARTELEQCLINNPPETIPMTVSPLDGMFASATIPCFFPPVTMGTEYGGLDTDYFVDGGVRAVLPVEGALVAGADQIFAIMASKDAPDRQYMALTMPEVALRSLMDLAINEIAHCDAHPLALPDGVELRVIAPRVDIHQMFTVYPALVRIRMAYGWMCAADVLQPPAIQADAERARDIADSICRLRYGVTRLEAWLASQLVPPSMILLSPPATDAIRAEANATLRAMKDEIRQLVTERTALGARIPAGDSDWDDPNRWFVGQEVHPWNRSPRDDAELIEVSVPTTMTVGSTATAAVVLYNSGNTVWNPQNGYRLGSNDNLTWGVNRVDLGERIHPGQQARFDIPITAPTQAGRVSFVWQMLRDGGTWFGESAGPVVITVTPPAEPAECLSLRDRIAAIDQTISQLADAPDDDPRLSAQTRRQIQELRSQRGELVQQAQALGCTL